MRLPVISELMKGNNSEKITNIIGYLKRLVRELQTYIDKNDKTAAEKCIVKLNINSGWLTVTYNDGTKETIFIN